jgi:hypothetical protein
MKNDIMVGEKKVVELVEKCIAPWQPRSMGATEDPREHILTLSRGWPKKQFPPLEKEMKKSFHRWRRKREKFPTVEEGIVQKLTR